MPLPHAWYYPHLSNVSDRDGFIKAYSNALNEKARWTLDQISHIVSTVTQPVYSNNLSVLINPPGFSVRSEGPFPVLNIFMPYIHDGDKCITETQGPAISAAINRSMYNSRMPFEVEGLYLTCLDYPGKKSAEGDWDIWIALKFIV